MTKTDIDNIIEIICPNDEDFEKPCISPAYLKKELEILALEQEPCEDCISRQATVERLCKVAEFMNEKRNGLGSPYVMAALFIQDNKDEFPSVTPQPKTGRWIDIWDKNDYSTSTQGRCTICKQVSDRPLGNFCKWCGAKMEVSK